MRIFRGLRLRRYQRPLFFVWMVAILLTLITLYQKTDFLSVSPFTGVAPKNGLTYSKRQFYLNGQPFRVLSGALHYFRVHPDYWEDRLKRLKSAGLNTVETYCPWNLHEEVRGVFTFDGMLNIRRFLKTAHQLGLYVILRPGPYICAEWEFGGLPSWLLADPNMKVRSLYFEFMKASETYLHQLLTEVHDFQYTLGGNIIAFQVENEYGSYGDSYDYIAFLHKTMKKSGVKEMFFICNSDSGFEAAKPLPNAFVGINFNTMEYMGRLASYVKSLDPDMPLFGTEFWTGWFHNWGHPSNASVITIYNLRRVLHSALSQGFSMNFYMMHGGTTFGFMNGGSDYLRVISSYDYFAPISEAGYPTDRYYTIREEIMKILTPEQVANVPDIPVNIPAMDYGEVVLTKYMDLNTMLEWITPLTSERTLAMEELPINSNGGQSFGYILYRTQVSVGRQLRILGRVADRAQVLLNGRPIPEHSIIEMGSQTSHVINLVEAFTSNSGSGAASTYTLDILVENLGRANYANYQSPILNMQRRGIFGPVYLDSLLLDSWKIYPMEFKKPFLNLVATSEAWKAYQESNAPRILQGEVEVLGTPQDTFVNTRELTKGVVFINGFNLGRHWNIGPQYSLYVPAPLLHPGKNQILIFEQHAISSPTVRLFSKPDFTFTS